MMACTVAFESVWERAVPHAATGPPDYYPKCKTAPPPPAPRATSEAAGPSFSDRTFSFAQRPIGIRWRSRIVVMTVLGFYSPFASRILIRLRLRF